VIDTPSVPHAFIATSRKRDPAGLQGATIRQVAVAPGKDQPTLLLFYTTLRRRHAACDPLRWGRKTGRRDGRLGAVRQLLSPGLFGERVRLSKVYRDAGAGRWWPRAGYTMAGQAGSRASQGGPGNSCTGGRGTPGGGGGSGACVAPLRPPPAATTRSPPRRRLDGMPRVPWLQGRKINFFYT